ncbi:hypothetical protein T439DRAFT_381041 [Meredithblackwellia eburnea MCA 4105]
MASFSPASALDRPLFKFRRSANSNGQAGQGQGQHDDPAHLDPFHPLPLPYHNKKKNNIYSHKHYLLLLLVPPLFYYCFLSSPSSSSSRRTPFLHPLPPPTTNTSFSPTLNRQIPPYVHYVFGLSPSFGDKPFAFLTYLCLSSALVKLKPEVIYFHYVYLPQGWWWDQWVDRVQNSRTTRLQLVKQRDVTTVFGNPVEHFAHKADVLRLEVLRDYGGIYLDIDVLVIKDMAPLYHHQTVMGMESQPNLDPLLPPSGLCNAVILSKPYSSFIVRWLESYRTFSKEKWASHSVTEPWTLAQSYPTEVTVLNKFAFFWPLWHDDHLRIVHRGPPKYSFTRADPLAPTYDTQFTYHLWESVAWPRYLKPYDPDRIHNRGAKHGEEREEDGVSDESSFSRFARQFVGDDIREKWREAVKEGLVT